MNPITYLVLQAEQLSKQDKIDVAAKLASVRSPSEISGLSSQQVGWSYEVKDHHGRIGIVGFRGAEVALLIKRRIVQLEPLPQDPIPEGIIEDPIDAWMRVDLLGTSSRNVAAKAGQVAKQSVSTMELLKKELAAKDELIDQYELEMSKLRKQIADQTKKKSEVNKHGSNRTDRAGRKANSRR